MLDRDPFRSTSSARSLKSVAYVRLRDAIRTGELEPGSALSETTVATRFGFGKAAVRDALARLSATALVVRGGRRWRVADISGRAIGEVLALRRRLEPMLLDVAHDAGTLAELSGLAGVGALADSVSQDPRALGTLLGYDRAFMDRLLELHPSEPLRRWLGEAWDRSAQAAAFLARASRTSPPVPDRAALVEALRSGERDAALAALADALDDFSRWARDALLDSPAPLHEGSSPSARSAADPVRPAPPSPPALPDRGTRE